MRMTPKNNKRSAEHRRRAKLFWARRRQKEIESLTSKMAAIVTEETAEGMTAVPRDVLIATYVIKHYKPRK